MTDDIRLIPKLISILLLCFLLTGCTGINFPNAETMLINFSSSFPGIWRLTTGLAYLLGIAFIMRGIYQLKQYGMGFTMMSSQSSIKGPLILLTVGAALMFLPTMKAILLQTSFGYGQELPIAYNQSSGIMSAQAVYAVLALVQLVGVISFVRGWMLLAQSANPSGHSQFGKAMTHIVGGLFAINIQGTVNILKATFGIQ